MDQSIMDQSIMDQSIMDQSIIDRTIMDQSILYKYEPKRLEDFSHEKETINFIKNMIAINNLNFLLFGGAGTGKTVLLNAIVHEYYNGNVNKDNILYINNLNEQGISYYRNEMKIFCQSSSLIKNKKKLIVIDDLDTINEQGQQVFRSTLDKYSNNVHCIASCTNTLKVIDSLQSRMNIIKILPIQKAKLLHIIKDICTNEVILLDSDVEEYIISISNNSVRLIANYLEKFKLMDMHITIDLAISVCTNISFKEFDEYTLACKRDNDLNRAIKIIYGIFDRGYSVMDILDNYFMYVKMTTLLTEEEKYTIIPNICKYITIFNTIHEDEIELVLFTKTLLRKVWQKHF
jgi:replication factor C subunit 2/4